MDLDEILLVKGKGLIRKKDSAPISIKDGNKYITYCSVKSDFSIKIQQDITLRASEMPSGVNGYLSIGAIPLDRDSEKTQVQLDYFAFTYEVI
jgi:hypothetical protein